MVRHVLFDRAYYAEIERLMGRPLERSGVAIKQMDACSLGFADESFDYLISNSVLEHVHDVDGAVREMARVLRPGGVVRVSIHLFPCLSGGHRMEWAYPDEYRSDVIPPWDHLRERRFPAHVYLNEWRESHYLRAFSEHFDVLDSSILTEGEHVLTPEIRAELADWSLQDLTHATLQLLATRPR
jgi:SAM-dependent methyltransferase